MTWHKYDPLPEPNPPNINYIDFKIYLYNGSGAITVVEKIYHPLFSMNEFKLLAKEFIMEKKNLNFLALNTHIVLLDVWAHGFINMMGPVARVPLFKP